MIGCIHAAAIAAKSLQSCLTLCDPIDGSPPGSAIRGILQARTLEWVAISFSNAWKWKVKVKSLSCVLLLAIPWTAAYQAPPSMGFSRQEYWSGVPHPPPGHFPNPEIEPVSLASPALAGRFFTTSATWGAQTPNEPNLILYIWRRQWHPTPVLLPGESHGRRSLVGCSPWGH